MKNSNDPYTIITQALEEMKIESGSRFSICKVNLAKLSRRTGISRAKLRRFRKNGFKDLPHGLSGRKAEQTVLTHYSGIIDKLLAGGVKNSEVIYERLKNEGYSASIGPVKRYIKDHAYLIPAQRTLPQPQENRGRRYCTEPGEAFQMDWGFTDVLDYSGTLNRAACFAMICHHCGKRYIEFFPNAKQENLFIGMLHGFKYMGIPRYIITDNMKSVVIKRDMNGQPVWQKDYELFMKAACFQTKLCKAYHPFTKGKVERLVRYVKDNFLAGRVFMNVTDLNEEAVRWCNEKNDAYKQEIDESPSQLHDRECIKQCGTFQNKEELLAYMCPERRISFDGFVNYEGRRFGVPCSYTGKIVRVNRSGRTISIYSDDMKSCLVTHDVTWSRKDRFCKDQYVNAEPEEVPTAPVRTRIEQLAEEASCDGAFDRFNFDVAEAGR